MEKKMFMKSNMYELVHTYMVTYIYYVHGVWSDAKIEICVLTLFKTSCWECLFVQHFIGQK